MVIIKQNFQKITNTTIRKMFGLITTFISIPVAIYFYLNVKLFDETISTVLFVIVSLTQLFLIGYYTESSECLFRPAINKFYVSKKIFWCNLKKTEFFLNDFHAIKSVKTRMMHNSGFVYAFYVISIIGENDTCELGTVDSMDQLEKVKELSKILRLEYVDH